MRNSELWSQIYCEYNIQIIPADKSFRKISKEQIIKDFSLHSKCQSSLAV